MNPITSLASAKQYSDKLVPPFGYNLDDALFSYQVALSNVLNQLVRIYCVGDSITQGVFTSAEPTKSWVGQLRSLLQSAYGNAPGEGFINVYESSPLTPAGANPRWSIGAGWVVNSGGGFGGYWADSNTAGNTTNSTCPFSGTSVTLLFVRVTGGGTADIKVDGVSKGTINCANASTDFTQSLTITGLTSGAHTLTVTPTGNGRVLVEGIIENGGATSGLQVNRLGRSGWKVSDWMKPSCYARWATMPPHLVTIALGFNEANGDSVPVSTYKGNLETLVQQFQTYGASVILIPYFSPAASWTTNWEAYVNANYQIADKYHVGVIDLYRAWQKSYTLAQTQGLFGLATNDYSGASGTNNAHPGDKGHNFIAQIIKSYLTM